jgi:restriction endonuclease Mrr
MQLGGISADDAALAVPDGTGDNGIDALYYDRLTKTMYVVQAKWHSDGNGAFDRADMLKFTKGFDDLTTQDLARFNAKMQAKATMIREGLHDDKARYVLVPIHTGTSDFAPEVQQDLDDCLGKIE